jgi:arsenate reductase
MADRPYHVLFLCTGNSARSILSEALLNARGGRLFRAYSAGSHPTGRVNPFALEKLRREGLPTEGLRSKSWDEFAGPAAEPIDFIFTVCDNAAGEVCPIWPGRPMTAHWGIPDPAGVQGTDDDRRRAFDEAFQLLARRIDRLVELPIERLDVSALAREFAAIGQS